MIKILRWIFLPCIQVISFIICFGFCVFVNDLRYWPFSGDNIGGILLPLTGLLISYKVAPSHKISTVFVTLLIGLTFAFKTEFPSMLPEFHPTKPYQMSYLPISIVAITAIIVMTTLIILNRRKSKD